MSEVALELLPIAIGVGLVVSLLITELFGLAAGGMVVPGYIALFLDRPGAVVMTLGAGLVTFLIISALSSLMILYGRRLTALTILVGYLVGLGARAITGSAGLDGELYAVIGFIIPGLIAIWFYRQGVVETVTSILTVSVLVRMALLLLGYEVVLG